MAKIRSTSGRSGYLFIKELGGAIQHAQPSSMARWLVEQDRVRGRVLDYGCGYGFDADHFNWIGFDPYYRNETLAGFFDTIICNHVANMLTQGNRTVLLKRINDLLAGDGIAYIGVPRNIPNRGKMAPRQRIQNYVTLTLPSVYCDEKMEIYMMTRGVEFADTTKDIEKFLTNAR